MRYSILDIESTGGKRGEEAIIDIAIFQYDGRNIIDCFASLVNPEREVLPYVQKLTNIFPKSLRSAPKFYEIARRIIEITDGAVLVGHNVSFDYYMLRLEFSRLGFDYKKSTIDTLALSRKFLPGEKSYSLGKLASALGISIADRHRALGDARATLELFQLLIQKDLSKQLSSFLVKELPEGTMIKNAKLIQILTDHLPEDIGLFYFYNVKRQLLYMGAARNLRWEISRFLSLSQAKDLLVQTHTINVELTGTALIAFLRRQEEKYFLKPMFSEFLPIESVKAISQEKLTGDLPSFISDKDLLLLDKGRSEREKSFVWVKGKQIKGYGYYSSWMLPDREKLQRLLIPFQKITSEDNFIKDEFLLSLGNWVELD